MNKLLQAFIKIFKVPKSVVKEVSSPDTVHEKPLGHISKHFESARSGPGTISSGRGDPGGVSYGNHQLASFAKQGQRAKPGAPILSYMKRCIFAPEFENLRPTSKAFNKKWKEIAKKHPQRFAADQLKFIKKTHFDGLRGYANGLGILDTKAINEALFSIGVQHGGAKKILKRANINNHDSEKDTINKLYNARERYVRGLRKLPAGTKKSVLNRYKRERKMVLDLTDD